MFDVIHADQIACRLALLIPHSRCILVESDASDLLLPHIMISKYARHARSVQKTILCRWNLAAIVLDFVTDLSDSLLCVAELLSAQIPSELMAVTLDHLHTEELTVESQAVIESICNGESTHRGPFSRTGWIREAVQWIRNATGNVIQLSEGIEQHNACGTFALVQLRAQGGLGYWLKATGEPNQHELAITMQLAELAPAHLPELVARRCDWNAWVMEDAGEPLTPSTNALERAVVSMAELQRKTIGHTESLLAVGATDQRMSTLRLHVPELILYIEEAMEHQISIKVPCVSVMRLREIGRILEDAYTSMDELRIPDTVIHNDISPQNILFGNGRCVFIDWCEGYVGCPFLTLQRLLRLLPENEVRSVASIRLEQAYKDQWLNFLTEWQIDKAIALMPLLTIASYLYGRGDWLRSNQRNKPHMQSYARTLARYMDRAAQAPLLREALCR